MSRTQLRQLFTAWMMVALVLSSMTALTGRAVVAAPVAQSLRTQEVAGVLTGGQFAKIWLGLLPETKGQSLTVITEWDRVNPENNGLGFYLLDEEGLRAVLNGSSDVRDANMSAGSKLAPESPDNQLGAVFQATGDSYTIVLFNDSPTDANFTVKVTNGFIIDDSGQVRDLLAAPTAAATGEGTPEAEDAATAEPAETEETAAVTTTVATTATATPAPAATTTVTTPAETATPAAIGTPGVVRAQEVRGELAEQNAQHILGLEPSERNGTMVLTLSYDPQDNSELARRLNFWVLDQSGLNRYRDASVNVILSEIAIAAGSSDPQIPSNQRKASFTASGFGPYSVIVYNNSSVPATYSLRVDGGILIDDSNQTLTARQGITGTATVTGTVTGVTTTVGPGEATPAPSGRTGEPGGTYTVQAGDSLSLIARDIYGDLSLWDEICAYNNLSDCNVIEVGDVINLPTQAEISAGIESSATPAPAATPTPAATTAATATVESEVEATPEPEEEATPTTTAPSGTGTSTGTVTTTGSITGTGSVTGTGTTTTTDDESSSTGGSAATADLVATLNAQGSFNTLVQALSAAGLTSALEDAGPFTIFAPTDAAFAALPAGALDQLLGNPMGQLTKILFFHVVSGKVMSDDLVDGMSSVTQEGAQINFTVSGGQVKVQDSVIVAPDVEATNGVIHAIDKVMIPPDLGASATPEP